MATSTNTQNRGTNSSIEQAKQKPSKFKWFLTILLLSFGLILVSVGATMYFTWPASASLIGLSELAASTTHNEQQENHAISAPKAKKPIPTPSEKPVFSELAPFTVTIRDGGRSRAFHVAITPQVADKESDTLLKEYSPVVRDRVLKTLSEQDPNHIQTPEGREQLVASLLDVLRSPYGDDPSNSPRIQDVLFTAFVIQ